jgi:molecular chaperone DnaK
MEGYIGINFGTTNTSIVYIRDDEYGRQEVALQDEGGQPFSSIVAIPKDGGKLLFGREVREKRNELSQTHEIFTSMKSYLGKKEPTGEPKQLTVGSYKYNPKDVVSAYLKHIKEYIELHYNYFNLVITEASFSYPVDFTSEARKELCEAANNAGIKVKTLINESTAAYIAYRMEGRAFSKVMVLDWGGGTLDISILKLSGTKVHEIAVWGDHVGGDDIDLELAERVHSRIAAESGIDGERFEDMLPAECDQMIMRCEEAKISISDDGEDYPLTIRNYGAYGIKSTNITAEQFNDIVEPIIKTRVLTAIDKALGKAGGLTPSSIDGVIIVGGSSNLSAYARAIKNLFSNAKIIYDPKKVQWATATGAALMHIIGGSIRLNDSVGVLLSDDSVYEILPSGLAIGEKVEPITFSLMVDALSAHFIFTNYNGKVIYEKINVPTKGFLKETLVLTAEISEDQIAIISVSNKNFGNSDNRLTTAKINKLDFHYDISALNESTQRGY